MNSIHTGRRILRSISIRLAGFCLIPIVASCGMKSVSTQADSGTLEANTGISVSIVHPTEKTVQDILTLNGTIRAENEVDVVAETQGTVTKVYAGTGTRIAKGDVLAQIDDELKLSTYKTAQVAYDKSKSDWEKAHSLFAQNVISDSDLQGTKLEFANAESQLLTARRDHENAKVRSPLSGVVTEKFVTVGSLLAPGTPVAHVVDIDNLKMTVQIGERDILKLRVGLSVDINSDLYPNEVFAGKVAGINPKGDAALTFLADIALKGNVQKPLYDGMSAKARVNLGSKTSVMIPRSCLVGSRQIPQVYVIRESTARLANIEIGREYGTDIEVLSGLAETDQVVAEGQNNLVDGAVVTVMEATTK
jgi:membrane fusion protein, multidrug efflux system